VKPMNAKRGKPAKAKRGTNERKGGKATEFEKLLRRNDILLHRNDIVRHCT
ncbi:1508_t:CDS:2, partial [Scutellospora calospora]